MIRIDDMLPEIKRAVQRRVESSTLEAMEPGDLRRLVYKLIERQQAGASDPAEYFTALVEAAEDQHMNLDQAMDHSIAIRRSFLRMLLEVLEPAMPLLVGPIIMEATKDPDSHEERVHHPILRGIELINGEKKGQASSECIIRSGVSWWLIGLPPDETEDPVSCRYAMLHHNGRREGQRAWLLNELELVSSGNAARQIRDFEFSKILQRLHGRLLALQAEKIAECTDQIWDVAQVLEVGLQAMNDCRHRDLSRQREG